MKCKSVMFLEAQYFSTDVVHLTKYNMLIEFDGEQHYGIKTTFPSESIEHTMKHDVIKNGYAKSRGIKLVRISYKHRNVKDIDSILSSLLLKE